MINKRRFLNWETLPVLLDADTVSALLGINRSYVSTMAKQGKIPGAKQIGRFWYFEKEALRNYFHSEETRTKLSKFLAL